jgi:hypothetical protein
MVSSTTSKVPAGGHSMMLHPTSVEVIYQTLGLRGGFYGHDVSIGMPRGMTN